MYGKITTNRTYKVSMISEFIFLYIVYTFLNTHGILYSIYILNSLSSTSVNRNDWKSRCIYYYIVCFDEFSTVITTVLRYYFPTTYRYVLMEYKTSKYIICNIKLQTLCMDHDALKALLLVNYICYNILYYINLV